MITEIRQSQNPDQFDKFNRIKHLRSLLREFSYHPRSKIWCNQDESVFLMEYKFMAFLSGDQTADDLGELLDQLSGTKYLLVNHDETNSDWEQILGKFFDNVKPSSRWAFSSEELDLAKIKSEQRETPDGYLLKKLSNEDHHLLDDDMGEIGKLTYDTVDDLFERTASYGVIETATNTLVALCTGYPMIEGEWEIDIKTKNDEKYRRKGFGSAVARGLMIDALSNNIIPKWDAANKISHDMALKLGFTHPIHYLTYLCVKKT